jgi:hypothetical protein
MLGEAQLLKEFWLRAIHKFGVVDGDRAGRIAKSFF